MRAIVEMRTASEMTLPLHYEHNRSIPILSLSPPFTSAPTAQSLNYGPPPLYKGSPLWCESSITAHLTTKLLKSLNLDVK